MMKKSNLNQFKGKVVEGFPWWDPSEHKEEIKLHLSLPVSDGNIPIQLDNSIKQALNTSILGDKLRLTTDYVTNEESICRARNRLAASFLESGAEWQLQVDPNIVFPSGYGQNLAAFYSAWMDASIFSEFMNEGVFRLALSLNAVDEILRGAIVHNKTIVSGLYFWNKGVKHLFHTSSLLPYQKDGFSITFKLTPDNFIETDRLGAGFMLVHRSVYEDIQSACPELYYHTPVYPNQEGAWAYYLPSIQKIKDPDSGKTVNEYRDSDYSFSWRARFAGHHPCINMNILLGNLGKHVYSWFDRPILQKEIINHYSDTKHKIDKQ